MENGLDWRSAAWKKVWIGGLLRGKRPGMEVCWEEDGMVWISAARKIACSTGLPVLRGLVCWWAENCT